MFLFADLWLAGLSDQDSVPLLGLVQLLFFFGPVLVLPSLDVLSLLDVLHRPGLQLVRVVRHDRVSNGLLALLDFLLCEKLDLPFALESVGANALFVDRLVKVPDLGQFLFSELELADLLSAEVIVPTLVQRVLVHLL